MNAPFSPAVETTALADLHDVREVARIEAFVAELGGSPFHRPLWLRAIESGTGQRAFGLITQKRGVLTGWLPLTEVRSPIFPAALVSSGFAVGGGPLVASSGAATVLARAATELAQRHSCASLEWRGGPAPEGWSVQQGKHANFSAPLQPDDEAQLLAVPRKQRAEVRKGLARDFAAEVGTSPAHQRAHYRVYAESVRNLGTPVFPRALFAAVLEAFGPDADILALRLDGVPVASVLTLYSRGVAMPYWGGGTHAARATRANERMYFELMRHARTRGCHTFDFGRSKVGSGAFAYKKNWGFTPAPLAYSAWYAPGQAPRDVDPTSGAHSAKVALWKRLPLAVADRIGPPIARGLG